VLPPPESLCFAYVCLSIGRITLKSCPRIFRGVGCVTSSKRLDYGGDPDYKADIGICSEILTIVG